jgi:hypothetical protein
MECAPTYTAIAAFRGTAAMALHKLSARRPGEMPLGRELLPRFSGGCGKHALRAWAATAQHTVIRTAVTESLHANNDQCDDKQGGVRVRAKLARAQSANRRVRHCNAVCASSFRAAAGPSGGGAVACCVAKATVADRQPLTSPAYRRVGELRLTCDKCHVHTAPVGGHQNRRQWDLDRTPKFKTPPVQGAELGSADQKRRAPSRALRRILSAMCRTPPRRQSLLRHAHLGRVERILRFVPRNPNTSHHVSHNTAYANIVRFATKCRMGQRHGNNN